MTFDFEQAYEAEKARRIAAEKALDEKAREVESSMNMIRFQYLSLTSQKRGLELLLNIAQMGALRLQYEHALKIFIDAIGQLFEAEYGMVYLLSEEGGSEPARLLGSSICYLPRDQYPDAILELLSGQRSFDENSPVGQKVLEGTHVIEINRIRHRPDSDSSLPDWLVFFPVRKNGEIVAVAELGVKGWRDDNESYLTLAMAASSQIGVMLERAEAHQQLEQNYHALKDAHEQLKSTQSQLIHSEKMASIGQLAAGVAHEINNPVGFVLSNIDTLQDYMRVLLDVFTGYERLMTIADAASEQALSIRDEIDRYKRKNDFAFILDDFEQIIKDSTDGLVRVKDIVLSLKNFARADEGEVAENSVDEIIEESLKMIWNEVKYHVEVVRDFAAPVPIPCNRAQISQVVMNLVINAAQAIKERGEIRLRTRQDSAFTLIEVSDNGSGIPPAILSRIFDPFFTTKPVDVGTGLGLSISHGIVHKHGGRIEVESVLGAGTIFRIYLPMQRPAVEVIAVHS